MDDDNPDTKLKGDLTEESGANIFPRFIISQSNLFNALSEIRTTSWEREGARLLEKRQFDNNDIKIAKRLIMKGIPDKYRGEIWFIASGAKVELEEHPGYYAFLLNSYPPEIELPNEKQIDLDINRTFPEDPYFFKNTLVLRSLRNILLVYSKRNLSIGYVQGFNFIAGRLLKYIKDEEKAFWTFSQIIEDILPINYYSEMAGVMIDVDLLVCLMNQKYIPDFASQMKEGFFIYLKNIVFQWFLSLFILNLSDKSSLALWDAFFLDKSAVLFKAALSLLKAKKDDLLMASDLESLRKVIITSFTNSDNVNFLKTHLLMKKYEFDQNFLDVNRLEIKEIIIGKINKINEAKIGKLKEKTKMRHDKCDLSWPYCIYECNSYYTVIDYFILQPERLPVIAEDYATQSYESSENDTSAESCQRINFFDALIERKGHVCQDKIHCQSQSLNNSVNKQEHQLVISQEIDTKKAIKDDNKTYEDKKSKYKQLRTQNKCISSMTFVKTMSKKEDKMQNFDAFVSKMNFKYNLVSNANCYQLKSKKEATEQDSRRMSLTNIGTHFL